MNKAGIDLLKEYEGWRDKAYIPIPGDVPTIGYGFTTGVKMGDTMTRPQGEARLKKEVAAFDKDVIAECTAVPNENQLAAMTCFAYNAGMGWKGAMKPKGAKDGFRQSTVLKAHNRADSQSAARAFGLWNKSGGVVVAGLTRRRSAEAALYLKPIPEEQKDHPMPQTIDPESTMTKSPINLLGAAGTAGGVLGTVSSLTDQASDAVEHVGTASKVIDAGKGWFGHLAGVFGLTPLQLCCAAAILLGAAVMFYRWRQRKAGWA